MAYKALGYLVWNGGKRFLRRRYGPAMVPKKVLFGGLAGLALTALIVGFRRNGSEE